MTGGAAAQAPSDYHPTGRLLSDSGFRPGENGFSFANYGSRVGLDDLTPAQVADIFGPGACVTREGASCILTPGAQKWMEVQNAHMAGGHCMGLSVAALRFFTGSLREADYGAPIVPALRLEGNPPLQEMLAENWTYQTLPAVERRAFHGSPNEVLKKLETALKAPARETWTVGVLNEVGGHAVTPYAVEERPGGKRNVLVYDNNFPGITRVIEFDTKKNSYLFRAGAGANHSLPDYTANARTSRDGIHGIYLLPTTPGTRRQHCPFCQDRAQVAPSAAGVPRHRRRYDSIHLSGDPANHGHLLIRDRKGHRLGYHRGRLVNEIRGAQIVRPLTTHDSPEPTYRIPVGLEVTITIDGSGLERADTESLSVIGPSELFHVERIRLRPGQKSQLQLTAGNHAVTYRSSRPFGDHAPTLVSAAKTGRGVHATHYVFAASSRRPESKSIVLLGGLFGTHFGVTTRDRLQGRTAYRIRLSRATRRRTDNWIGRAVDVHGRRDPAGETETGVLRLSEVKRRNRPVVMRVFHRRTLTRLERLIPDSAANRRAHRARHEG